MWRVFSHQYTRLTDAELITQIHKGQERAASELIVRHSPKIYAQAWRLTGSREASEDIVQEAMIRLWRQIPVWDRGAKAKKAQLSSWLYRVTTNLCIDHLRRQKPQVTLEDSACEIPGSLIDAETQLVMQSDHDQLYRLLEQLPARQRIAISLRYLEEWTNPQIAAEMSLTVSAVESLIKRGKSGLAQLMNSTNTTPRHEHHEQGTDKGARHAS